MHIHGGDGRDVQEIVTCHEQAMSLVPPDALEGQPVQAQAKSEQQDEPSEWDRLPVGRDMTPRLPKTFRLRKSVYHIFQWLCRPLR